MDKGDNTDLEKIQLRREKHKARGINGNGFGMSLAEAARQWPSPMAGSSGTEEYNAAGNSDFSRKAMEQAETLLRWAVPRTSDTNGPGEHGDGGLDLRTQASKWPGPAARDHKGSSPDCITRQDGKSRADMLDFAAEQFFRPPSSPDQPIAGGSMSSTDGPNTNQPSVRRKLNPIFVEALMRWPTGLSGFERQETAWTRWWLLMPSFVSELASQKPRQGTLW